MARLAALLASLSLCAVAAAQSPSYVDEILPLETKVVHLVNELRAKYRSQPERLKAFEQAHDAWNAYRNGQCTVESANGGKSAFARCTRRVLELRVKELEALE